MARPSLEEQASAYGFNLAFLESDPELERLFMKAVKPENNWSADRFVAALQGTKWFKKNSASVRSWVTLEGTDPATARAQVQQRAATISTLAAQLGIVANTAAIDAWARKSLMYGWDDNQLKKQLAGTYHYSKTAMQTGTAGSTVTQMQQIAAQYLVPLSTHALNRWTQGVLAGRHTIDDFKIYAQEQAQSLYPELKDALTKGDTVQQYMDPYQQVAAQTLGIAPESVDWRHSKWGKVFKVDENGKRSITSLADWGTMLKTDPTFGFDHTHQAVQAGTTLGASLAHAFGVGGTA